MKATEKNEFSEIKLQKYKKQVGELYNEASQQLGIDFSFPKVLRRASNGVFIKIRELFLSSVR